MYILRYIYTVKYLRKVQWYYLLQKYIFASLGRKPGFLPVKNELNCVSFPLHKGLLEIIAPENIIFKFLNQRTEKIPLSFKGLTWHVEDYDMLWNYQLNYCTWLLEKDTDHEVVIRLLTHYYENLGDNKIGLDPYPTAQRMVNLVKFLTTYAISDDFLLTELMADVLHLEKSLEHHLQGNHLLEDYLALYIASCYLKDYVFRFEHELIRELRKQILLDGMHFERSPMYHLIITQRLLDALNFSVASRSDLTGTLRKFVLRMISFYKNWSDINGIPAFHDTARNYISWTETERYAIRILGKDKFSEIQKAKLSASGYRNLICGDFLLIANVGSISPDYQPGHSHAEELSFEIFFRNEQFIVNPGTSTYSFGDRRLLERSSIHHNCVTLGNSNSSDVWSSFRVGKRAKVVLKVESSNFIKACHVGYKDQITTREFRAKEGGVLQIRDILIPKQNKSQTGLGRLHFHPSFTNIVLVNPREIVVDDKFKIIFSKDSDIKIREYLYAKGFNELSSALLLEYTINPTVAINIYTLN